MMTDKDIIKLIGTIEFEFKDLQNFYSYYQIKRNYRSNINKINLDFVYDMSQKKILLDNLKINDNSNKNIDNFLEKFNSQNKTIFNKVTIRNFVKEFFSSYAG